MKNISAILLSFVCIFSSSIKTNIKVNDTENLNNGISVINSSSLNKNFTHTIEPTSSKDNYDESESPETLAYNIFDYYGITLSVIDITNDGFSVQGQKMTSKEDILNINSDSTEDEVVLNILLIYDTNERTASLTASNYHYDYKETIYLYPEFEDTKFEGNVLIVNENEAANFINIFDMDELTEEELQTRYLGITICSIALWKIIACAVVAIVAVTIVAYPEFYVSGIDSLCDTLGYFTSQLIDKVKYKFTKMVNAAVDTIQQIRQNNNKNIYYLAIPIINDNVNLYSDVKVGDMLISDYPVTYSVAKKALKAGYSIYTFENYDAYRAIRYAWVGGYALEEPCNDGFDIEFYSHYHAYYKVGNRLYKRYVELDGVEISIHGFYGYPW